MLSTALKLGLASVLGIGLILALVYLPVNQSRIVTAGEDSYAAHRPLFGQQTQAGDVQVQGILRGAGAILVDLRHRKNLSDVTLTATNPQTNEILGVTTILGSNMRDDLFASALFPEPITGESTIRLTFASPSATNSNAIGIRLDPNSPRGHLATNLRQPGELAIILIESVPLERYLLTNITQYRDRWYLFLWAGLVSIALAGASAPWPQWGNMSISQRRIIKITLIALIALGGVATHLAYLNQLHGVSGGDPYNYLYISRSLAHGQNPFAGTKRLPGWPLLLVPGQFLSVVNDIKVMQIMALLSAAGVAGVVALLARQIGLPWSVQIIAPALLMWQKDFFWTAWRPEPYTFYSLLLLTSLWLFFKLRTRRWQYLFGFVLGYAAMTRQEGFVLAVVLGAMALLYYRKELWWQGYARAFAPALLLVSPFLIHNTLAYDNPFFTPYFEGDRLQIVNSWEMFKDSAGATWGILSSSWKVSWQQLTRVPLGQPFFLLAVTGIGAWWWFKHSGLTKTVTTINCLLISVTAILFFTNQPLFQESVVTITAAVLLISAIPFLIITRWPGAILLTVLLSQLLIATWFHPFSKHYQQSYPLLLLMLTTALLLPGSKEQWWSTLTSRLVWIFPLTIITLMIFSKLPSAIDKANRGSALDHVTYQAVQLARTLPGPYGFDEAYLAARLYFEKNAHFYTDDQENIEEEKAWLKNNNIHTMVVTDANRTFRKPDANWQKIRSFKTEGKNEVLYESTVYIISPS